MYKIKAFACGYQYHQHSCICLFFISGQRLLETLENGVSRYPRLDGRFPQVSGIRFQFDPYKKSGERVDMNTLTINGRPLQIDKVE